MRLLIRVVVFVAVLIVGLIGIAFLLPSKVHVERSEFIAASPATLHAVLNGFGKFDQWSPWAGLDPDMKVEIGGPAVGIGARYAWRGNAEVGMGVQEIVAFVPDRSVTLKLDFEGFGHPATIMFTIEPKDDGSVVTWSMDADLGSDPMIRYVGLMMNKEVEADYEKGLAKLKTYAERLPPVTPAEPEPTLDDVLPAEEPAAAPETAPEAAPAS